MKLLFAFILLFLLRGTDCNAQGSVINFKGSSYTTFEVDLTKSSIQLLSKNERGERFKNAKSLEELASKTGRDLLFATNAGIFSKLFTPLGLHIEKGNVMVPLNTNDGDGNFYFKPNGVFYINGDTASVISTENFDTDKPVDYATQSGPLLLENGVINGKFNAESENKLIRSGVGVKTPANIMFAISDSPVTFYEFALFFRDELKCQSALYLDGVISKMYVADLHRKETSGNFAAMFAVFSQANDQSNVTKKTELP